MPRKSTADRLKTLRDKREQLDAQLRALEARNKHYEKNPDSEFHRVLFRLLDDRALFPELSEADPQSTQHSASTSIEFIPAGRESGSPPPAP
jgi:vacuolar-type H+-ATPase subunit D/Vma8